MRIAVAMSGGVDSSVAAALLVDQGFDVFGVMMRLWVEDGMVNRCCAPDDVNGARRVAGILGIPFFVLDMRAAFRSQVVSVFLDGYAQGATPNPCMECNRTIRWGALLTDVVRLGATHLATGHYARAEPTQAGWRLLRAVDRQKDQSYVLSVMGQAELTHAVFPLGGLTKDEVRRYARTRGLPVADREESQDLCFLGGQDYRLFLRRHGVGGLTPGPILDRTGAKLGEHSGLAAYTIGQRRGLGVSASEPYYVLRKERASNALIVGRRAEMGEASFRTRPALWVSGNAPQDPFAAQVQTRYHAASVACRATPLSNGTVVVDLDRPLPDVAPGQSAVFYQDDICLGSAVIAE